MFAEPKIEFPYFGIDFQVFCAAAEDDLAPLHDMRLVGNGEWRWSALGYVQIRQFYNSFASVNAARTAVTVHSAARLRTPPPEKRTRTR